MFVCRDKEYFFNTIFSGITIHLFSNDITPDKDTLIDDYKEVNADGYSPIFLAYGDFKFESDRLIIKKEFPVNRQALIYGYYLTAAGNLIGGERFTKAPYKIYITGIIKLNIKVFLNIKSRK